MMIRVHGDDRIQRRDRANVQYRSNYHDYIDELRDDFHSRCGYCGKLQVVASRDYQIDHFVPQSLAENRRCDYANLVYSCSVCNYKKSNKWPTGNPDIPHDDKVGFVDPASKEYDTHLCRDVEGNIIPKTPVGEYMCKVFQFSERPIKEVWMWMKFDEKVSELEKKMSDEGLSDYERDEMIDLNTEMRKIRRSICGKE